MMMNYLIRFCLPQHLIYVVQIVLSTVKPYIKMVNLRNIISDTIFHHGYGKASS